MQDNAGYSEKTEVQRARQSGAYGWLRGRLLRSISRNPLDTYCGNINPTKVNYSRIVSFESPNIKRTTRCPS